MKRAAAIAVLAALLGASAPVRASGPAPATEAAVDLCKAHGVLAAVCTKCNPALAAIFKAKGDWCAEHGFPESFCPTCRPAQGGRPAVDVAADQAPANGLKVKLRTPETARLAGIETVKVQSRPARPFVAAVLRISYDATRVASVTARAPGVLRSIDAHVGSVVPAQGQLAAIESASTSADRSRVDAARARLTVAEANRARERSLSAQGIVAKKDLLAADQELAAAKAELDTALAAVKMAGEVTAGGRTTLVSPIAGVVTKRTASVGQMVDSDDVLFELVDTRSMWAELDIPETDIGQVRVGQVVDITIDSLPGRNFSGRLVYLSPSVDPETRTVTGRVVLANPAGELRENMFGHARILVGDARLVIPVPRSSVQKVKEITLAFIRRSESEFETRRIQVGQSDEDTIEIVKGLEVGDDVVTTGSFLLKTETLKDSIGAGCCEADAKK